MPPGCHQNHAGGVARSQPAGCKPDLGLNYAADSLLGESADRSHFTTLKALASLRASTMLSSSEQYVHPPYRPIVCTPCAARASFWSVTAASEVRVMWT